MLNRSGLTEVAARLLARDFEISDPRYALQVLSVSDDRAREYYYSKAEKVLAEEQVSGKHARDGRV